MWTAQGRLPKEVMLELSLRYKQELLMFPKCRMTGHSNLRKQYGQKFGLASVLSG